MSQLLPQLQFRYWTAAIAALDCRRDRFSNRKPRDRGWIEFPLGSSEITMYSSINSRDHLLSVGFNFYQSHRLENFRAVQREKTGIEAHVGCDLDWNEMSKKTESRIRLRTAANIFEEGDWQRQHQWLAVHLTKLHDACAPKAWTLIGGPKR